MEDCDTSEAFTSLWSVTDKISEHVADIRNLLNTTTIPVIGSSSDDPRPYESSTSERVIDQLKERVSCLEDLNNQRKLLYDQHANKRDACLQVENVHPEDKQQVWDINSRHTFPDASTPRDVVIEDLRSFLRARQAALTENRLLWAQIKKGIFALPKCSLEIRMHDRVWYPEEEKKFYALLRLLGLYSSQRIEDQSSLLRDGKILEEKILSVSHDRGEEARKVMRRVQDSYRQARDIVVPTFFDLVLPIFKSLQYYGTCYQLKYVFKSIATTLNRFNGRYVNAVESYQNSLQDLANLLLP